jgi:hypothetical protein
MGKLILFTGKKAQLMPFVKNDPNQNVNNLREKMNLETAKMINKTHFI